MESLRLHHKLVVQWAETVLHQKKVIAKRKVNSISESWPNTIDNTDTYLEAAMVAPTFKDDDSITLRKIESDIQLIKSVDKKHKGVPNTHQTLDKMVYTSPLPPHSAGGAMTVASNSTVVVKEKNVRTIAFYKIFFSTREYNKTTKSFELTLGDISEDFTGALEASSKNNTHKHEVELIPYYILCHPIYH